MGLAHAGTTRTVFEIRDDKIGLRPSNKGFEDSNSSAVPVEKKTPISYFK